MTLQEALLNENNDYEVINKIAIELHDEIVEFYKNKSLRQSLDYTQTIRRHAKFLSDKMKENKLRVIIHLEKSDEVKKYANTSSDDKRTFFITITNKEPARVESIAHELTHIFDYIKAWPKHLRKDKHYRDFYGNKDRQYEINKAYMEYSKSFDKNKREHIQNLYIPYFKTYAEFNARLTNLRKKMETDKHVTDSYKNILNALEIPTTELYMKDVELKKMILTRLYREGLIRRAK